MQNLDFDFEKCCSVSLSSVNVYACLVCGAYFQGRGAGTHAHTHSVEEGHHLFIKLDTGRVFCIPDNYEVVDRSLKDIQHVLNPQYSPSEIAHMDSLTWARTLEDADYMPGLVGLNNMKRSDYFNVVLQCLLRVHTLRCAPLPRARHPRACSALSACTEHLERVCRDFFLEARNYSNARSDLVRRFGELVRKVWNARAFRGQVLPFLLCHPLVREVTHTQRHVPLREAASA